MKTARLMLGCLALVCLALANLPVSADDKAEEYSIVIKRVEVKQTKANGDSWDINNGKPDLRVIVRNLDMKDTKAFETKEATDTFSHEFNEPANLKVRDGQTLEFEVVDVDVAANDTIGKVSRKVDQGLFKSGKLKFENFGQVITLEVELKKL